MPTRFLYKLAQCRSKGRQENGPMTSLKVVGLSNTFELPCLLLLLPAQKDNANLRCTSKKEPARTGIERGGSLGTAGDTHVCSGSRQPTSWGGVGCVLGVLTQPWVCASASVVCAANSPEQLQAGSSEHMETRIPPLPLRHSLAERAAKGSDPRPKRRSREGRLSYPSCSLLLQAIVNSVQVGFSEGAMPLRFA